MCILPNFYLRRLENAILQASSVSSSSLSASNGSALESSQRLDVERYQSQDGLANACLQLTSPNQAESSKYIVAAQYDAVSFYALTTIQRSLLFSCINNNFSALLRGQLRSILSATLFFATKIAVLLALLLREEYPTHWSNPVRDVLEALHLCCTPNSATYYEHITFDQIASMSMYLSFLDAINDEIVYPSADAVDTHYDVGPKMMQQTMENGAQKERTSEGCPTWISHP